MVKEDGLVVVGERHTKETVIQDCNSYIKVIIYWNLFSSSQTIKHKYDEKCIKVIQDCNIVL